MILVLLVIGGALTVLGLIALTTPGPGYVVLVPGLVLLTTGAALAWRGRRLQRLDR